MKNLFLAAMLLMISTFVNAQLAEFIAPDKTSEGAVKWEVQEFDFGLIEKSKPASTQFTFKNTSNENVVIENVKTSCGCTATNYPKSPIAPGKSASISVSYNANKTGNFSKTVWVTLNVGDSPTVLKIKGTVN